MSEPYASVKNHARGSGPRSAAAAAFRRRHGERRCRARRERLARRVYARTYDRLVANVAGLHPELAAMMIEQGYGRVLSRPGLDRRTRELVAVAVLAAGGWGRQLVSHLLGAIRCGALRSEALVAARIGERCGGEDVRVSCAAARAAAFGCRWRLTRTSG